MATEKAEERPDLASRLFDLRTVIAVLFVVYGVTLVLMGAFGSDAAQRAKAGGTNLNLWTGIAMVLVGAAFLLWVRLRPLQPLGSADAEGEPGPDAGPDGGPDGERPDGERPG
jgi:hypothetical protein